MIVTCNRIPVNPDHAAAFEARFADRASLVDGMGEKKCDEGKNRGVRGCASIW